MAQRTQREDSTAIFSTLYTLRPYSVQKQSTPFDGKSGFIMDIVYGSIKFTVHDKNKTANEIIFPQQDVSAVIPNGSFYPSGIYFDIRGSQESINELTQRANNFEVQIVFSNLRRTSDYSRTADVLAIKIIDKRQRGAGVISQVVPDRDDAVVISKEQEAISPAPQRQPVIKNEAVRRLGREALRQVLNSL